MWEVEVEEMVVAARKAVPWLKAFRV